MDIAVRPLQSAADYAACVVLQHAIWGPSDAVPASVLMIAQKVGALAAGAFDASGTLLGCVFGLTGTRGGQLVHWSHFLAVQPEMRGQGIGRRLKHYQREVLLSQGIELMYWTFDPLVARNAHLNLNRLGVAVEEYVEDMYGGAGGAAEASGAAVSPVDAVIGTDRFIVKWDLAAGAGATERQGGSAMSSSPLVNAELADNATAIPRDLELPEGSCLRLAIPADINVVKDQAPEVAARWRATTRRAFRHYLARGYRVAHFQQPAAGAAYACYTLVGPDQS